MTTPRLESPMLASKLRPHASVMAQKLDGRMVLVHLDTNQIYELNSTGARLWELLASGYDGPRIREALLNEFAVDAAELDTEIENLLSMLAGAKLVTSE